MQKLKFIRKSQTFHTLRKIALIAKGIPRLHYTYEHILYTFKYGNRTYGQDCTNKCGVLGVNKCSRIFRITIYLCHFLIIKTYIYKMNSIISECSNRTYGQSCSEKCGFCFKQEQCNHVNGICLNGCDSGYKGEQCNASKLFYEFEIYFYHVRNIGDIWVNPSFSICVDMKRLLFMYW